MVLELVFALCFLCSFVTTLGFLLLNGLLSAGYHALILTFKVLSFFINQVLALLFITVHIVFDCSSQFLNISFVDLFSVLFLAFAHTQLPLQLVYFFSILTFIVDVAICASLDFSLHLLILLLHVFDLLLKLEILIVPLSAIDFILLLRFTYNQSGKVNFDLMFKFLKTYLALHRIFSVNSDLR